MICDVIHLSEMLCQVSQFRKRQFDKNTQKNASKCAIFIEKENPHKLSFRAIPHIYLTNALFYVDID